MRPFLYLISFLFFFSVFSSAEKKDSIVIISLKNNKYMSVQPCTGQIFRIRISSKKEFPESLMERYGIVKTGWGKTEFTTEKLKDKVLISTKDYKIIIDKRSGAVKVNDLKGKELISEINFLDDRSDVAGGLKRSLNSKFEKTKTGHGIIGDVKYSEGNKSGIGKIDGAGNSIVSISLKEGERFYGGGSTSRDNINHRGEALRMWATYQLAEVPVPFLMSSNGWGVFNNTTSLNFFDVGRYDKDKMYIYNTVADIDIFIMLGNSMNDILGLYTDITGKNYLLPKWMYGMAFGGNVMEDQIDMMNDAVRFRDEKIPCDVFWIEPQWMSKYYDYSTKKEWNQSKFPGEPFWEVEMDNKKREHPHLFIHKLHGLGYKLALWLCIDHDLSIAAEDEVAQRTGKPLSGREHWFDHLKKFIDQGVDGFKLDPGRTLDEHPGREYYNGYTDNEMHNLNQILLQKQMEETFRGHKGIRSFHHYCGGYAGSQHWGAMTSGDNGGGEVALFDQLNLGLSGYMNTTCDVLEVDTGKTLQGMHMGFLLPWVQINSWYGLLHPWYFPPVEREAFKFYSQLRHRLLPYIYSAAINGSQTGMPILRAMALEFPGDSNCDNLIYQYMFGDNLLVGVSNDSIYLPDGKWIDFWTGEKISGGRTVLAKFPENRGGQLFIRSGAIIPFQKTEQYITLNFPDTLTIKVYPNGRSTYTLMEDDGISYGYEKGKIAKTTFTCDEKEKEITIKISSDPSVYKKELENRNYRFEIYCEKPKEVFIDGRKITSDDWSYCDDENKLLVNVKSSLEKTQKLTVRN